MLSHTKDNECVMVDLSWTCSVLRIDLAAWFMKRPLLPEEEPFTSACSWECSSERQISGGAGGKGFSGIAGCVPLITNQWA